MKKSTIAARALVAIVGVLLLIAPVRAQQSSSAPPPPPPPPSNSQAYSVGILPFTDLSRNPDLGQLSSILPALLQTSLANHGSLAPRQIQPGASAPGATGAQVVATAYAVQLGQYYRTNLVLTGSIVSGQVVTKQGGFSGGNLGGLQLGGNSNSQTSTVTIQINLVDVGRGQSMGMFQATGKDRQTHIDPNANANYGTMNMQSSQFQNSSLSKATNKAMADLTKQIFNALKNFTPVPAAASVAATQQPAVSAGQAAKPAATTTGPATAANTPQNPGQTQPQNAAAIQNGGSSQMMGNSSANSGATATKCTVQFRVMLLNDMSVVRSGYTVTENGRDVSSQISNGALTLANVPSELDLHIHFASSPVKAGQPADYDDSAGFGCDTPSVSRLILTIDSTGNGNFNIMN